MTNMHSETDPSQDTAQDELDAKYQGGMSDAFNKVLHLMALLGERHGLRRQYDEARTLNEAAKEIRGLAIALKCELIK